MSPDPVPLFPLNTVLFPGGLLPLRIFETRYIDMVRQCMRESTGFVILSLREGEDSQLREGEDSQHNVHFNRIGTQARIIDWEQRSDGLLGILASGEQRVVVANIHQQGDGLWLGEVQPLSVWPRVEVPVGYSSLVALLSRLLDQLGPPWSDLNRDLTDAAWVCGRLTELLPLSLVLKQRILEEDDPLERLRLLHAAMMAAVDPGGS